MNSDAVQKMKFGSPISGAGVMIEQMVTFNLSGSMVDGRTSFRRIDVPLDGYFVDAWYRTRGTLNTPARPWVSAPRSQYLDTESALPTPRVYLYMISWPGYVEVLLLEVTLTGGTVSISGTYNVDVNLFIYPALDG